MVRHPRPWGVPPITFAHRGGRAHEADNTLPAFSRALATGAAGLESDVWRAADGVPVLVHDHSVRRGLRRTRVAAMSSERLSALGIPSLAELYETCGTDYELSLDLKHPEAADPTLATSRHFDAEERLWLCSPDAAHLVALRANNPTVHLVHSERSTRLTVSMERHAADLAAASIDAMNMHHTEWTGGLVALFHRFDVLAFAWDAQETRQIRNLVRMGVDGVFSDHVDRMLEVVGRSD